LYANQANVYLSLPRRNMYQAFTVLPSSLQLIENSVVKHTNILNFKHDDHATPSAVILWAASWVNTSNMWTDSNDKTIHFETIKF